jgi:phenylacetate-CoA ligase
MARGLVARAKGWLAAESLIRRNPLHYPKARATFERLMRAPLPERRAAVEELTDRALARAARTGYGRSLGAPRALADWPLLAPATVRGRLRDFTTPAWGSVPSSTGGTTGIPLPLRRSPRAVAAEQAALDVVLAAAGVNLQGARIAVLRGDDIKPPDDRQPPFWKPTLGGRRLVFSSNHLGRDTIDAFAGALAQFRADLWWVYPTTLEALMRLGREAGLELRAPLILSSSEVMSPALRETARRQCAARVLDYYGQAERVAFAWCADDGAWRFLPGYARVELVPVERDGETLHEIVGTSLWNEAMPLVRYRTGDLIRLESAPDDAALEELTLGLRSFGGVIGRDGDVLIAPDGTRLTGIDHFHRGVANLMRIQVIQSAPSRVEVLVIPASGYGERERSQLLENARRKLPGAMAVEIREVTELRRTAAGKTPFVIRAPSVG